MNKFTKIMVCSFALTNQGDVMIYLLG